MRHCSLFCACLAAGLLATASNAAVLSMSADKASYLVGETIVLTLTGDSQGDPADVAVRVIVAHDPVLVSASGVVGPVAPEDGQTPDVVTQFGGMVPSTRAFHEGSCGWAPGRGDQCLAWDQIPSNIGTATDSGSELSILEYVATDPGVAAFSFQDGVGSDFSFFDQGNGADVGTAPLGTSVTIMPEPKAMAQVAVAVLGLVLCASVRRARRTG